MFGMFCRVTVFLSFVLFLCGCAASSSLNGGFNPDETLSLDDDYSLSLSLEKSDVFALDVHIPVNKGFKLVGASFDPGMLRLEHYLEYNEDGAVRARYIFTATDKGVSDILIKMEPVSGGDVEVYRMVSVNVGETGGSLFSF